MQSERGYAPGCRARYAPGCRAGYAPGCRAGDAPGCRAGYAPGCRAGYAPGCRAGYAPGCRAGEHAQGRGAKQVKEKCVVNERRSAHVHVCAILCYARRHTLRGVLRGLSMQWRRRSQAHPMPPS
eukprot:359959-Chlamydomonas_euryale.AAC.8